MFCFHRFIPGNTDFKTKIGLILLDLYPEFTAFNASFIHKPTHRIGQAINKDLLRLIRLSNGFKRNAIFLDRFLLESVCCRLNISPKLTQKFWAL